jgi:hypothetical protein
MASNPRDERSNPNTLVKSQMHWVTGEVPSLRYKTNLLKTLALHLAFLTSLTIPVIQPE